MTAFDITSTARAIQTHLQGSGLFYSVDIGRPSQPPGEGPSATIHGDSYRVLHVTSHPVEQHVLKVRIYRAQHTLGDESKELEAMTVTGSVMALFFGDFTLGANIRNVDVAGEFGVELSAQFTDDDVAGASYHITEITIPLVVDNTTVLVA